MLKSLSLSGALLALFMTPITAQEFGDERPNVVFIGLRELSTTMVESGPNLKSLIAEGVLIPQAETTIPHGQPELAVMMTGLLPQQSKVFLTTAHPKLGNAATLADLFQSAGYATYGAGFSPAPWADLAFDATQTELNLLSGEGRNNLFGRIEALGAERPFFLWWFPSVMSERDTPVEEAALTADEQLGNIIEGIKRLGKHDSTLYVIVNTGAKDNDPERRRSRASRRQSPFVFAYGDLIQKGQVHDVLASSMDIVPTILDFAGIEFEDLKLTGTSLRTLLTEGTGFDRERVFGAIYSKPEDGTHPKSMRDTNLRSLSQLYSRDGRWKYVLYLVDVRQIVDTSKLSFLFSTGDQELFDLQADPTEQRNLAGVPGNQELILELRRDLLKWWKSTGSNRPPVSQYITPLEPKRRGSRAQDPRPNIVLIISDDHDNEHFGFLGNDQVQMPVLDKLAEAGTVFSTAHVTSSRSRPSLASLLTGRYPHQNKITANKARYELRTKNSLPNLLKSAGYATFMGGRFLEDNRYAMGFTSPKWEHVSRFVRKDQDDVKQFLAAQADKRPFFIWWAPTIPSEPFNAPPRYVELFEQTTVPMPASFVGNRQDYVQHELDLMAMEAWFDDSLGQLLAMIEEQGQLDNTLFCFLTDNGSSNFRPSRGSTFEKGLRTPIVFHYKDKIQAGARVDDLTSSLDIFPTLLDFAGVPAPKGIGGHSLRPVLEGGSLPKGQKRKELFGAGFRSPRVGGKHNPEMDMFSIYMRDGEWKYVLYVRKVTMDNTSIMAPIGLFPGRAFDTQDLFNLKQDPYEFKNLAGQPKHAERIARMRAAATKWWLSTGGKEGRLLKK